jgi:hypothetical protein
MSRCSSGILILALMLSLSHAVGVCKMLKRRPHCSPRALTQPYFPVIMFTHLHSVQKKATLQFTMRDITLRYKVLIVCLQMIASPFLCLLLISAECAEEGHAAVQEP